MTRILALLALAALAACSQATDAVNSDVSVAKLQSDTAVYFATSSRNVRVGNLQSTLVGTSYNAKIGGRMYDCQYFRGTVSCNAT